MTQTHELDCSDAAKMMIERMQTNPEDFNYGGKLYRAVSSEAVLSKRDSKAYNDAHDRYIKEPALMATVLQALLVQPEKENVPYQTQGRYGGGITGTTVNKMWFDANTETINSVTREMYEDQLQRSRGLITDTNTNITAQSALNQIYAQTIGRQRIERDN